jgi:hypothetical protein
VPSSWYPSSVSPVFAWPFGYAISTAVALANNGIPTTVRNSWGGDLAASLSKPCASGTGEIRAGTGGGRSNATVLSASRNAQSRDIFATGQTYRGQRGFLARSGK